MKNEKITIVVLSYIIGFTTAFIGFGLQSETINDVVYVQHNKDQSVQHTHVKKLSTLEQGDGLYALINGSKRILSAQAISAQSEQSGYHHRIVEAAVSPNAEFIYYCSQQTEYSDSCLHFVYDLATDLVYRMKHDGGEQMSSPVDSVSVEWAANNKLIFGSHISMTELEPWRMIDR